MAVLDVIERDGLQGERRARRRQRSRRRCSNARSAAPRSATCAATGCSSASRWSRTAARSTPDSDRAIDVVNKLKDQGFLTSNAGAFRNVVKIRPPLVFGQRDADEFLTAFDATIAEVAA